MTFDDSDTKITDTKALVNDEEREAYQLFIQKSENLAVSLVGMLDHELRGIRPLDLHDITAAMSIMKKLVAVAIEARMLGGTSFSAAEKEVREGMGNL